MLTYLYGEAISLADILSFNLGNLPDEINVKHYVYIYSACLAYDISYDIVYNILYKLK